MSRVTDTMMQTIIGITIAFLLNACTPIQSIDPKTISIDELESDKVVTTDNEYQPPLRLEWIESNPDRNSFGYSVAGVGDVNGDGYDDILISRLGATGEVSLYAGSELGPETPPIFTIQGADYEANIGYSVVDAGDINGDGFADFVIRERFYDYDGFRLSLYAGGQEPTKIWQMSGESPAERFGFAISGVGDVNMDGFDDLLIGAPGFADGLGQVKLFLGEQDGLGLSPAWQSQGDSDTGRIGLGEALTGLGDVNGDGFHDVIIAATDAQVVNKANSGYACLDLFFGNEAGLSDSSDWSICSREGRPEDIIMAVDQVGDLNGDGFADLAIGSQFDDERSNVFIYSGGQDGMGSEPTTEIHSTDKQLFFGGTVTGVGDVNLDGYDDIIIGFVENELWEEENFPVLRGQLHLGTADGPTKTPQFTLPAQDLYHQNRLPPVDSAGDVNGDGVGDLVLGAPSLLNERGRVYLYYGINSSNTSKLSGVDSGASSPENLLDIIFTSAQVEEYNQLGSLCDPLGKNDLTTQSICDMALDSSWEEWFGTFGYADGKIVGDVTQSEDEQFADLFIRYPNQYDYLFGDQAKVTLVNRGNRWYLYSSIVSYSRDE